MFLNTGLIAFSILATGVILLLEDWRGRLASVSIIQLIGFILIVQIWPIALASVKLISGLMGIALLSTTFLAKVREKGETLITSSRVFRLMMGAFGWIIVTATVQRLNAWLPISYTNLFIGMVFFFSGILYISLRTSTLDTILGLLVFLEGFDVIYSSLEGSALVTGIYGIVIISICLTGSYLEGGFNFGGSE
ncbi:MAG TPA: hypothetical protein VMW28_04890 [Pelolinea sp.]|nr:hypothetical protein [Pelolinea sp.]